MSLIGVGTTALAHHSEKKMVAQDGSLGPAQTGNTDVTDWDAGWDSDEKDEPIAKAPVETNPASAEKELGAPDAQVSQTSATPHEDDDDAADAWGWGDDDATDESIQDPKPVREKEHPKRLEIGSAMREVTLSEPYWISSIPKLVFDVIKAIYDDGTELTKPEYVCTRLVSFTVANFSKKRASTCCPCGCRPLQHSYPDPCFVPRSVAPLLRRQRKW